MDEHWRHKAAIVRGDLYGKRDPRPSVLRAADREIQERIVAAMAGKKKRRSLGRIQQGKARPLSQPLKIAAQLQDARMGYEESYGIVMVPQLRALARMHGRQFDTGEFDPPTPKVA